jgi:peptidoglycan/xylan/chitin deacetylase (PgdA/CDA1 family)
MVYLCKTPGLLKKFYPECVWNFTREERVIYLTFDDGPHALATPFVLETLKEYNAKATFFCIGKNVVQHPDIYKRILEEGHTAGNHTYNHLNGWKTPDEEYIRNINEAKKYIDSKLFRPPYGRITKFQIRLLTASENVKQNTAFRIIMWDVLSADFDHKITGKRCAENVVSNTKAGSIVVFHDSEKAFKRLETALPETLRFFSEKGFTFKAIS